ncbi:MAG: hypothetical protein ACR2OD_10185 [Gaiellaceae bacterium]
METLIAFFAALLTLRLAGVLAGRWRESGRPELAWWATGLAAYALATGALAWGAAAGWDDRVFRLYYLFGGLLTAPLLAVGSLRLLGITRAAPVGLVFAGLAVGLALAAPIDPAIAGSAIPEAQAHLEVIPLRIVAILANALGTLALVGAALLTLRRHPLATVLILAGIGLAAAGSAVAGTGAAPTSAFVAVAACLLYAGFATASGARPSLSFLVDLMKGPRHGHRAEIT